MQSLFPRSVSELMFLKRYAKKTTETYIKYIKEFIRFKNREHLRLMGDIEVEAFLTDLVIYRKVAVSTQTVALNAISF